MNLGKCWHMGWSEMVVLGTGELMCLRSVRWGFQTMVGGLWYKRVLLLGPARCPRAEKIGDWDA